MLYSINQTRKFRIFYYLKHFDFSIFKPVNLAEIIKLYECISIAFHETSEKIVKLEQLYDLAIIYYLSSFFVLLIRDRIVI